jgi:hypothetical protein
MKMGKMWRLKGMKWDEWMGMVSETLETGDSKVRNW